MHGTYTLGSGTEGLITGVMIFTLLRAFANGGASLTGIEAVSDAVGAFNPPEGRNARKVLDRRGHHPRHPGGRHRLARARDPRHSLR